MKMVDPLDFQWGQTGKHYCNLIAKRFGVSKGAASKVVTASESQGKTPSAKPRVWPKAKTDWDRCQTLNRFAGGGRAQWTPTGPSSHRQLFFVGAAHKNWIPLESCNSKASAFKDVCFKELKVEEGGSRNLQNQFVLGIVENWVFSDDDSAFISFPSSDQVYVWKQTATFSQTWNMV